MKKRKQKSNLKKLQKKCEDLWKLYCYLRDGKRCMVKKYFPEASLPHSQVFQVDHCFSRQDKNLFLDIMNGTVVCSNCNMAKSFGQRSVSRLIDEIVISREGQHDFNEMKKINLAKKPNKNWNSIPWLEQKAIELTLKTSELRNVLDLKNEIPQKIPTLFYFLNKMGK